MAGTCRFHAADRKEINNETLSADAFSQTVTRFFGESEYRDESSKYISDNRVCHNIGSIYEGPAPEGSDNVLRRQNGLAIDHDAMRTFLDAWQP